MSTIFLGGMISRFLCSSVMSSYTTVVSRFLCQVISTFLHNCKISLPRTVHQRVAKSINALLAPVGEYWWGYMRSWPNIEMYNEDGAHASKHGSEFAAKYIWDAIYHDLYQKGKID